MRVLKPKPQFSSQAALRVAKEIAQKLSPFCERIQIVGSLRRGRATVGDIEILLIPKFTLKQGALFDTKASTMRDEADRALDLWIAEGYLTKRLSVKSHGTWGPQNKLAVHVASGIPVDFFSTAADAWWNALVVRTGGKQSNIALATTARSRGWSLEAYGSGFRSLAQGGQHHQTTSERDVFEFVGMPYLEPNRRK